MLPSNENNDRRGIYRISPHDADHLEVSVMSDEGEIVAYEIVDVTVEGLGARFPYNAVPAYEVGETVDLVITSPKLGHRAEVKSEVRASVSMAPMRYFSFKFEENTDLFTDASDEFFRLFNRRSSFRGAEPDPMEPVTVHVHLTTKDANRKELVANLMNISAAGLGICASPEITASLDGEDTVEVTLKLSDQMQPLKLVASIRYKAEHEGSICYGMKIDTNQTQDYIDKAEEIVQYMLARFDSEMHEVVE